ncbi:hypothetical protein KIS4809_4279 [Bacillus sp. ZZV12-4809]|nr:hypothetical protein KIS4809_4279 [Bacillus sp. ZZV12-4809]
MIAAKGCQVNRGRAAVGIPGASEDLTCPGYRRKLNRIL